MLSIATVATQLAHMGSGDAFYDRGATVANVAGVVTALVATILGPVDLFTPPRGSKARLATVKHGIAKILVPPDRHGELQSLRS